MGWKDEWADEKRFSEIVRVDNISKITNGVVHGLVEKLSKSPFFKKRKMSVLKARPCSSDCPPIRHESAIKEKTRKSSHSELQKHEDCPRLANFESIFTTNIMNNNSV